MRVQLLTAMSSQSSGRGMASGLSQEREGRQASQVGAGDRIVTPHPVIPSACLYQKVIMYHRDLEVRENPGQ